MTLPVGYFPCTQDPPKGENVARMIDEIVEQAELCEQTGFDGFFFTEHHQQEDGYLPAPVLMSGIVGARTKRIKVGTCVLLAPLYHPIDIFEARPHLPPARAVTRYAQHKGGLRQALDASRHVMM